MEGWDNSPKNMSEKSQSDFDFVLGLKSQNSNQLGTKLRKAGSNASESKMPIQSKFARDL